MEFEYDPAKSCSNKEKHGIDFEQAKALWDDPYGVSVPADCSKELRFALVAEWDQKLWYAAYAFRGLRIRLISVRRAKRRERENYEAKKADRRGI